MKKRENWAKPRHRVAWRLLRPVVHVLSVLKYSVKVEPCHELDHKPCLILMNHQTPFDQFFVAMAFKGPIYFVASEDIMSNGWLSRLIHYLVAPIPIKKQTGDFSAVMNVLRVAREGVPIAMAPEGNRTYSGKTEYMNPAVAGLARKMKMPIVLFRIEGGYGKEPRWSNVTRSGKMRAFVSRVIEPEEYAAWTNDQLYDQINTGLFVDEGVADGSFYATRRAEHLERAMYVCPFCGLSKFESRGNEAWCTTCRRKISYGIDKTISGVDFEFPFRFMTQWYDYQKDFVNCLDLLQYTKEPAFRDQAKLSLVVLNKRKQVLRKQADLALYGDRIVIDEGREDELRFPFGETTAVSVLGRNKLNIYHGSSVYQFKGSKSFNALKYVNFYYRYKNIIRGDENGKFLGL